MRTRFLLSIVLVVYVRSHICVNYRVAGHHGHTSHCSVKQSGASVCQPTCAGGRRAWITLNAAERARREESVGMTDAEGTTQLLFPTASTSTSVPRETKVIYHVDDEDTPYMMKIPKPPGEVTLADFKAQLNRPAAKFFFKSKDEEVG